MTLWYLNRSNGYVENQMGKPVTNYDDPKLTSVYDKLYTTVGAHVMLDTNQVFGQFQQALAQLVQMAQQRNNSQQQLPPDAQVVKDTSMAETQRKAAKDSSDAQIAQDKIAADTQKTALNNQTKVEIENAKLTHETIQNVAQAQIQAQQPEVPPKTAQP
jgi:hypothetical protein